MRVVSPATIQKTAITPASTQEHLKRLFDILIPTLHGGQRFIYSDGVLCDKGEATNFATQGESIVENYPLSFFTTTLSQRRIGLAISAIYDKGKDSFGLKDVGANELEAVSSISLYSPIFRRLLIFGDSSTHRSRKSLWSLPAKGSRTMWRCCLYC